MFSLLAKYGFFSIVHAAPTTPLPYHTSPPGRREDSQRRPSLAAVSVHPIAVGEEGNEQEVEERLKRREEEAEEKLPRFVGTHRVIVTTRESTQNRYQTFGSTFFFWFCLRVGVVDSLLLGHQSEALHAFYGVGYV